MDKLEYIPGDLVMTNGVPLGTSKNVVYRVTSSDPSKTLKLDDGTVLKGVVRLENIEGVKFGDKGYLFGDCCAWVKDIRPIRLSRKILCKNDWYLKTDPIYAYFNDNDVLDNIYLGECCDGWSVNVFGTVLTSVFYVHELQHLLCGLKINSEMEV